MRGDPENPEQTPEPRPIGDMIRELISAHGWDSPVIDTRAAMAERRALGPEYAACFCLGAGGAGDQVGVVLERDADGGVYAMARIDDQPVYRWSEICRCPDGQAYRLTIECQRQKAAEQLAATRTRKLLGEAEIPPAFADKTLESWAQLACLEGAAPARVALLIEGARSWLSAAVAPGERDRILFLTGNWGAGKSGLAAALLSEWISSQRGALFRTAPALLSELRGAPYKPTEDARVLTWGQLMAAYQTVPLLVLDDLGAEAGSGDQAEHVRTTLHQVLNERLLYLRPTIITTNLTGASLEARYGGGIASRLFGNTTRRLVLNTPDLRARDWGQP